MARTTDDQDHDQRGDDQETRLSAPEAMRSAARQLGELVGSEPSAVSALRATDAGWTADVEVVEVARVPDTTSILASYRVDLDQGGRLLGYERTRRYARGQLDR
ncbi:gas vesicle protein [Streptomyces buecherae]|uniref:Gas vesicle protein n=1 Tax=Streptomyces buecherae TaxID=2763006 RepID=A0A7H8NHC4_9ACTN|nr:gas vesicle protein [Streptomyces buecherae]QKW53895.1 gas vesicle protein [Streptomyces buecherae]